MADVRRRLLIAESDATVRHLLVQRFTREGFAVTELADPLEAKDKVVADQPDLVLLELGGASGLIPLVAVREVSSVPLLGVLWSSPDTDEAAVLDFGADDCVTRPVSFRILVARTNALLRRTAMRARVLRFGALEIDLGTRIVKVGERPVDLAAREFDLLAYLAQHPNEVISREQLLAEVWRSSADWQQRETVTEHVHRIRARLEVDPACPRWVVTVRGVGYRFVP